MRAAAPAVALALTLALGGCLPTRGGTETSPEPGSGPGRQLEEHEAQIALPITGDLPSNIVVDDDPDVIDVEEQRTEPVHCLDASFQGTEADALKEHEAVNVTRSYAHESWTGSASVRIRSYDVEVPDILFDKAGQAIGTCSPMTRFTTLKDDPTGTEDEVTTSGLSVPQVGDRAFAGRFRIIKSTDSASVDTDIDYLAFKRGHTLVTIVYAVGPESTRVPDLPARLAAIVDRNLEEG